jgi:hypothetical protein
MKTSPSARGISRIRAVVLCLAIAGTAAAELRLGESLAGRFGQVITRRSESPQAPNVDVSDLMVAAR